MITLSLIMTGQDKKKVTETFHPCRTGKEIYHNLETNRSRIEMWR